MQAIPLGGHDNEENSNFMQLFKLSSEGDPRIQWLNKKTGKYTSSDNQNEMLKVMSLQIIRRKAGNLHHSQFYTIMADETADASNKEQAVLSFRWVSVDLTVHKDFIDFYQTDTIEANSLADAIKDALLNLNLSISKVRGQYYCDEKYPLWCCKTDT